MSPGKLSQAFLFPEFTIINIAGNYLLAENLKEIN